MSYLDVIAQREDMVSPGISTCQGCGAELIIRRIMQVAGQNTVTCIPPGCIAGSGMVGWNFDTGIKTPVHITLLDNTASFLTGVQAVYERRGRSEVNMVAVGGDGASADCGFQSLSGAAERGEKMLYVCYDNEGYMNTGFQRSSTTSKGSSTSTTPVGSVIPGKVQNSKNLPFIMAMHNAEYVATVSPSHMKDFMEKVQKALDASKRGFAYLHAFSVCPTGWGHPTEMGIDIARKAVKSNFFPLYEVDRGEWKQTVKNPNPISIKEFLGTAKKFRHLSDEDINSLQAYVDKRYAMLEKLI